MDKNPKFSSFDGKDRQNTYNYLVFERWYGTNSKICIIRMNNLGLVDSAVSVCDSSYKNINPSFSNDSRNSNISHLFISWQRWNATSGRYGIYGRYYNIYSGWSGVYEIDTSGNCENPFVVCDDSTRFNIVYSKNSAIIYRRINGPTGAVLLDTNITSGDTTSFRKPMMTKIGDYYTAYAITYEKRMTGNYYSVKGKSKYQNNPWSGEVSLSGTTYPCGNLGFAYSANYGRVFVYYFEVIVSSYYTQIMCAEYNLQNNTFTNEYTIDTLDLNLSFSRMFDYLIVDKSQMVSQSVSTYICDKNNGNVYARFMNASNTIQDIRLGSDYTKYSIALSNKFPHVNVTPPYEGVCTYWGVYNKDSAAYSCLWGSYTTKVLYIENIKKVNSEIPVNYSLSQNYPNPFNPVTKFRFDVKRGSEAISIKIFDAAGRVVKVITDDKMQPGSYEAVWDASGNASGIYFIRMTVGNTSFSKKIVLIK
ncbi:MAG: T9SS type A sorting domain-containing protein [Bacteroidetes bacterium]|nr:T9SS type A sorting domain-containing protein [Bacteroidota bacterium]